MTVKDTAVTFFVLGLVLGMVLAFASCSPGHPDQPPTPQQTQPLSQRHLAVGPFVPA